jgi:hypothetical protein
MNLKVDSFRCSETWIDGFFGGEFECLEDSAAEPRTGLPRSSLQTVRPGTDVMILKKNSPKNLAKILAFFAKTAATFCKYLS